MSSVRSWAMLLRNVIVAMLLLPQCYCCNAIIAAMLLLQCYYCRNVIVHFAQ